MRVLASLVLLALLPCASAEQYDVIVYGATPAGVAAALAASKDGERVLLASPEPRIGGMVTNGLSHTDFRTFEALSGAYRRFAGDVVDYYKREYGEKAPQVSFRGTHGEPKVNLAVFEEELARQKSITVRRGWVLEGVKCSSEANGDAAGSTKTVEIALLVDSDGVKHPVPARWFIDATYEGDLLAAVGVPYRVGREGRGDADESLAPEKPDNQLQAYNFRLIMTKDPANRAPISAPNDYDRKDFVGILPLFADGRLDGIFGETPKQLFKAQSPPLPHGKFDINDMSLGPVRLSRPGANAGWPDGGGGVAIRDGATDAISVPPFSRTGLAMARRGIVEEHLRWNIGLLYFLQSDPAVPANFREEAKQWGWCKDEFTESAHVPAQLYVREARRMIGEYVYSERDSSFAEGDARAVHHSDSIAVGDYGPNCHGTEHEGSVFGGVHTGEFYKPVAPYQVPFGVILPKDVDNLLVTCAVSATHVGFSTLRFEPIWMSLGEAAGHAVHLSRTERLPLQKIPIGKLQARLHREGAATVYFSDVQPGHADFEAVQWWGTAGGFHGLARSRDAKDLRGKQIIGQYFEAFSEHAAELDRPLDEPLAKRWTALASKLGVDAATLPPPDGINTRGAWIRAAYKSVVDDAVKETFN